jgi:hypothetical protein
LLNVNAAAPALDQSVALQGTIVVPLFTLSPTSLAFGSQPRTAGPTAPRAVTVANVGDAPLRITSITRNGPNPGQFAHTNVDCPISPSTLAAGGTCTINVTFDPSSLGLKNSFLNVNVGAPATSQRIPLSGTGITP